jgi:hypothetical protein
MLAAQVAVAAWTEVGPGDRLIALLGALASWKRVSFDRFRLGRQAGAAIRIRRCRPTVSCSRFAERRECTPVAKVDPVRVRNRDHSVAPEG